MADQKPEPPPPAHPGAAILIQIAAEWGAVAVERKKRGPRR